MLRGIGKNVSIYAYNSRISRSMLDDPAFWLNNTRKYILLDWNYASAFYYKLIIPWGKIIALIIDVSLFITIYSTNFKRLKNVDIIVLWNNNIFFFFSI